MIGIGCTVFLSCESRYLGAMLFTVGLISICNLGYALFTGRVCFLLEDGKQAIVPLLSCAFGNIVICVVYGILIQQFLPKVAAKATEICTPKLEQAPLQTLFLALMCGLLMYIAVLTFRKCTGVSRYIGIITCIPTFILCGFEHSVADVVYLSMSKLPFGQCALFLLLVFIGNSIGGLLFPALIWLKAKCGQKHSEPISM